MVIGSYFDNQTQDIMFGPSNRALNSNLTWDDTTDNMETTNHGFLLAGQSNLAGSIDFGSRSADASFTTGGNYLSAAMGNLRGEGKQDLAMVSENGTAYLFFADDESPNDPDVTITGGSSSDNFGAIAAVGDFSGDGIDDLVIGAPGYQNGKGAIYIIFGMNVWPSQIDLATSGNVLMVTGDSSQDRIGTDLLMRNEDSSASSRIYAVRGTSDVCRLEAPTATVPGAGAGGGGGGTTGGSGFNFSGSSATGCQLHSEVPSSPSTLFIFIFFLSLLVAGRKRK